MMEINTPKPRNRRLTNEWLSWIAECRLSGWNDELIIESLMGDGFHPDSINKFLQSLGKSPIYSAAQIIAQRFNKLTSLVNIHAELEKLNSSLSIDRRSSLSFEQFKQEYYSKNRPVIVTDIVKKWGAFDYWTIEFLKENYGNELVEVMTGRESDPWFEINSNSHKRKFTMSEYIDLIQSNPNSNDNYLVANNHFFETQNGQKLLTDLQPLPVFINQKPNPAEVFFWLGPAGTVTPLHHDEMNVFLAQIKGRKKIILISPSQTPWIYNDIGVFSMLDVEQPDLEKFPLYKHVSPIELVLEEGEALFIPVGWWHHVRSLDLSISVSMINFEIINQYSWEHPNITVKY